MGGEVLGLHPRYVRPLRSGMAPPWDPRSHWPRPGPPLSSPGLRYQPPNWTPCLQPLPAPAPPPHCSQSELSKTQTCACHSSTGGLRLLAARRTGSAACLRRASGPSTCSVLFYLSKVPLCPRRLGRASSCPTLHPFLPGLYNLPQRARWASCLA